jgi:hypothetical protein
VTTTTKTPPDPGDWDSLRLNAVEVTYDFARDVTEIRVANSFFMLEAYSELKRRMENQQAARREESRRETPQSLIVNDLGSPEGT